MEKFFFDISIFSVKVAKTDSKKVQSCNIPKIWMIYHKKNGPFYIFKLLSIIFQKKSNLNKGRPDIFFSFFFSCI